MAVNHLIGKQRFTSRSDRERERLQAQISGYALRLNADRDAEARRAFEQRLQVEVEPPVVKKARDLEDFLHTVTSIVERIVPCPKCHHTGAHELSCPELRVVVGCAV